MKYILLKTLEFLVFNVIIFRLYNLYYIDQIYNLEKRADPLN
jgi:hypothetical protein